MTTSLQVILLMALSSTAWAQAPAPADKPTAPPAEKPMAHDMKKMHEMMGAMRPPVCLYEGKAYSRGALLSAGGIKPVLMCAPSGEAGAHAGSGGDAHAGHAPVPLGWQVYSPAKAAHHH